MSNAKKFSAALLTSLLAATGCQSSGEDAARASVSVVDRNTDAIIGGYDIESINGTYTGCTNRTGTWSAAITGSPSLDHQELSVILGDTSCALAVTQIRSTSLGLLSASAPMPLATTWGTARSFGMPIEFYANVMVSAASFGGDFTITLLYSDDPVAVNGGSVTAAFATVSTSSASAQDVAAPDYTISLAGLTILTDVSGVTSSVTGNVALTAGSAPGDFYIIVAGSVGDTYAALNTAYIAGTPVAFNTSIAGSSLLANGVNLTGGVVRSLIIAKVTNGVNAYQKLAITFNPPM